MQFNTIEGDYRFNYEDIVREDGNRFYARFKRGSRLNLMVKKSISQKRPAEEFSEPLIDSKFKDNSINMSTSLESFIENSNIVNKNKVEELKELDDTVSSNTKTEIEKTITLSEELDASENKITDDSVSEKFSEMSKTENESDPDDENDFRLKKLAELAQLEKDRRKLQKIKDHIMMKKSFSRNGSTPKNSVEETSGTVAVHDSDSNYSFSEYWHKESCETDSDSGRLPDYIPLGDITAVQTTNAVFEVNEPVNSVEAENTAANEVKCEAKIFLTTEHSRYLVTTQGNNFLQSRSKEHNVLVRMEWRSIGNVLIAHGLPSQQDKFHADLYAFFEKVETNIKKRNDVGIPKNRQNLIKYLRDTIAQLEKPMGNAKDLYERLRRFNGINTKASKKRSEQLRKELNMIFMGKCGLREGNKHLIALQDKLRYLTQSNEQNIPIPFRRELMEHLNYIFSSNEHDNYADLMQQYVDLKRMKSLPVLALDRKLLGLKINVKLDDSSVVSAANESITAGSDSSDEVKSSEAKLPTLMDINVNISTESVTPDKSEEKSPEPQPNKDLGEEEQKENPSSDLAIESVKPDSKEAAVAVADTLNDSTFSDYWSNKCLEFLKPLLDYPNVHSNTKALAKVNSFIKQAEKNRLSRKHYFSLSQIFQRHRKEN